MMQWLLVRHGETDWNVEGRVQGHVPTVMNERGRKQVEALKAALALYDIRAAYSSDLPRTIETAHILLREHSIAVEVCPELRELSYGAWEGLTYTEIAQQDAERYTQYLRSGGETVSPPGGETTQHLLSRLERFTTSVREKHSEGTLLIVGHGGSLRGLLLYLLELPTAAFWRMRLAPASCSVVEVYPERAILERLNDISHYRGLGL